MKKLIILLFFVIATLSACGSKTERFEGDLTVAPIYNQTYGQTEEGTIFFLNNYLYVFDGNELQIRCFKAECTHSDDTCSAYMIGGSLVASDGGKLYQLERELDFAIYDISGEEPEKIVSVNPKYVGFSPHYPRISNDVCYYFTYHPSVPVNGKVSLCRIPLSEELPKDYKEDYQPEILWETPANTDIYVDIHQMSIEDNYLLFTASFTTREGYEEKVYVYDIKHEKMIIDGLENVLHAAMHERNLVYIDSAKQQIVLQDVLNGKERARFDMPTGYEDEASNRVLSLVCDDDYIYVNHKDVWFEDIDAYTQDGISEESFYKIDVYDYEGTYVSTIDLSSLAESSSCAQVLCTTGDFIFIGEPSYPQCTQLFVVEKSALKEVKTIFEDKKTLISAASVGDIVEFGLYEQDGLDNGKEAIEWIVLEKEETRALLLSKYCLDSKRYHVEHTSIDWEHCDLRAWLNGEFLETSFNDYEESVVMLSEVSNTRNPEYYFFDGGNDTQDKVFLLSIDEANQYLKFNDEGSAESTPYAKEQGVGIADNGKTPFWLRSPGGNPQSAALWGIYGTVEYGGLNGNYTTVGVRPALWVNLE